MRSHCLVKVVIPIYKTELDFFERISLEQNYNVLKAYPRVFIKPYSLNIDNIRKDFPECSIEEFDDCYFQSVQSYNRLMMSPELYQRFSDSTYILICQLDAYIFGDELKEWCNKEYDYIGAPWVKSSFYRLSVVKGIRHWLYALKKKVDIDYRVGNGGLSLRRVVKHLEAVTLLEQDIKCYLADTNAKYFNEDVFFSVMVNQKGLNFKYPMWQEALCFSFDKRPSLCYRKNGRRLPFGCHYWYRKRESKFWFPIILPQHGIRKEDLT